ncbi:MAG: aminoacyl-histidine dipeptidase [Acidobacteriota bacterium]|nr:aminoacyl-histidine dipeptidase [Acidobacteriota bacterium]
MSEITGLKPSALWKHFEEICKIPHGSDNEKAIGEYVIAQAKKLGLAWQKDKTGNVVVRMTASAGKEKAAGAVLQGHLDMVNEKNSDIKHDFLKDPIKPVIRNGWVQAEGTTLGADNGIGVAAGLAVMETPELSHGPLEFLFTVSEETGLDGARTIGPTALQGRILLNLDSEEEGTFTIGCAGGADSHISIPLARKAGKAKAGFRLKIMGLRGGHSGVNIHEGRGNAIKLLARVLWQANAKYPFALLKMEGGNKHNAIPREAIAEFLLEPAKIKAFSIFVQTACDKIKAEFKTVEPGLQFSLEPFEPSAKLLPMTPKAQKTLLDFLLACPHGVLGMHAELKGLVETSTNLAILRTLKDKATVLCSSRSSAASALEGVRNGLKAVADLTGARIKQPEGYPAWTPNMGSALLQTMKGIYKQAFGREPVIGAIHAGLECGIIGEKFPGMDMISFGPNLQNPHSPDERVEIASVERFWTLIVATLKALAG